MNSKLDTATKRCTMCGEEKSVSEFRTQKQSNKIYTRPYCKDCEAIEVRRQYLISLLSPTEEQQEELKQIQELYRLRTVNGLNTFGTRRKATGGISSLVSQQLAMLKGAEHSDAASESVS